MEFAQENISIFLGKVFHIPLKNIQFVVECVKHGEKCLPSDAYFQIKDLQLLAVEDTAKEFNEFLLSLN